MVRHIALTNNKASIADPNLSQVPDQTFYMSVNGVYQPLSLHSMQQQIHFNKVIGLPLPFSPDLFRQEMNFEKNIIFWQSEFFVKSLIAPDSANPIKAI